MSCEVCEEFGWHRCNLQPNLSAHIFYEALRNARRRGAKWGANVNTHRWTATDTDGTQPPKSGGIWTFATTGGRFRDALQAGGQGFDSPQLH